MSAENLDDVPKATEGSDVASEPDVVSRVVGEITTHHGLPPLSEDEIALRQFERELWLAERHRIEERQRLQYEAEQAELADREAAIAAERDARQRAEQRRLEAARQREQQQRDEESRRQRRAEQSSLYSHFAQAEQRQRNRAAFDVCRQSALAALDR